MFTKRTIHYRSNSKKIIPFDILTRSLKGQGFFYKGLSFVVHTDLNHLESAVYTLLNWQKGFLLLLALGLILGFWFFFRITLIALISAMSILYFCDLLFNCFLIFRSFLKEPAISIENDEIKNLDEATLPVYTIFCPLYHEADLIPQFINAMASLDYPKDKLQVLLLLEENDSETIKRLGIFHLPDYFQTVIIPHSMPKTKPKALNYGLQHTKGEYAVIFDAEDIPEKNQLKKVYLAFNKVGSDVQCIQAKLSFYNPHQNILTRLFASEYSLWFDLVLTGLQSIDAPIPLGGTSNHFRTRDIVSLQGWDPFNVTEDADLGMRIAKRGLKTSIINSTTFEEANSNLGNWFHQRSRWVKGYIQTYLVHTRSRGGFNKRNGFAFQLVIGGKVLSMIINPIMWALTISYFVFRPVLGLFIESLFPTTIFYIALITLVVGNFLYVYYYMIGAAKRGQFELIIFSFIIPVYWLFMSIAAFKAFFELASKPHKWNKTMHGLHLKPNPIGKDNLAVASSNY